MESADEYQWFWFRCHTLFGADLWYTFRSGLILHPGNICQMLRFYLICGLLLISTASIVAAADRKPIKSIAEFEVAPDGDFVMLPVIIEQREFRFLVCTGLSTTTIDRALCEELALKEIAAASDQHLRSGKPRYQLNGRIGTQVLALPDGVETADYEPMRAGLDVNFHGELGMDFLRRYIVQIDFESGILRLCNSLPKGIGEGIKVVQPGQEHIVPTVQLLVGGEKPQRFHISTGLAGSSLQIEKKLFDQWKDRGKAFALFDEREYSRFGSRMQETGRLESVQLGSFRPEGLIVCTGERNLVGLSFLSRFLVTFDFAAGKMYLKKGAQFDRADARFDMWETTLERDEAAPVVATVKPGGPAARLGLRPRDRIESLNGVPAQRWSHWYVRQLLGRSDAVLTAEVTREGQRHKLQVEPAEPRQIPREKNALPPD
jgi:hypothetical protein